MANSNSGAKKEETKPLGSGTETQKEETKKVSEESRASILGAVKTPLKFFALIALIVEGILAGVFVASTGLDRTILIVGMIALVFTLIAVVAFITFLKPESLIIDQIIEKINPPSEGISLDAEAYQILCYGYDERNNAGKVKEYAEAALKNDKKDPNAWYFLGRAYEGVSNYNRAISSFRNSIKFGGPYDPSWVWYRLAWIYNQRGKYKKAEESAKKALEINQEYGDAWLELAHASKGLGKIKQSEEAYAKANKVHE